MLQRRFAVSVIAMLIIGTAEAGYTSRGYKENYQQQNRNNYHGGHRVPTNQKLAQSTDPVEPEGKVSKGLGLSAWGIVAIVLGVILVSTGGYYAFVLYPYVCKKERSYDMIELANVA